MTDLNKEAEYWNEEYKRCFGVYPIPPVGIGVPNSHAHFVMSAVIQYNNERLKDILERYERLTGLIEGQERRHED